VGFEIPIPGFRKMEPLETTEYFQTPIIFQSRKKPVFFFLIEKFKNFFLNEMKWNIRKKFLTPRR